MHKKNHKDENYKSISAFYCNVMESVLKIFEKGKTLKDFDKVVDSQVINIFDKITYKAVMPFHDVVFKTNRYTEIDLSAMLSFFLIMRKFYLGEKNVVDFEGLKKLFERIRTYLSFNKLLKETRLAYFNIKNKKYPTIVFEFSATYKNLHFENCKYNAIFMGLLLGTKIINFVYSPKDCYARYELEPTELAFKKELVLNERKKLINHNLEYLINYSKIVEDKDYYLWMKLAKDNDVIISFKNEEAREKWI